MSYPRTSPLRWVLTLAAALTVVALPVPTQAQTTTGAQTQVGAPTTTGAQTTGVQPTTGSQAPAAAQSTSGAQAPGGAATIRISIDSPTPGTTVPNQGQTGIGGWAADIAGPGASIDAVKIYLDGTMDGGGRFIGDASYGGARPDVAASLGSSAFTNTGFDFGWSPATLTAGTHKLYVYAHSVTNGWSYATVDIKGPGESATAPGQVGGTSGGPYGNGPGPSGPTTPYGGTYLNNPGPYMGGYGPGGGCAVDYIDFRTPMCPGSIGYGSGPGVQQPYPPYAGRPCIMIYPPDPACSAPPLGYPPTYPPAVSPPYGYPPPTSNGLGPVAP